MTQFAKKKQKKFFSFFCPKNSITPAGVTSNREKSKKKFFFGFFAFFSRIEPFWCQKSKKKFLGPQNFFSRFFGQIGAPKFFFFDFFHFFSLIEPFWSQKPKKHFLTQKKPKKPPFLGVFGPKKKIEHFFQKSGSAIISPFKWSNFMCKS